MWGQVTPKAWVKLVPTPASELRQRQMSVGWSIEDLELILPPMTEEGKEATGSMGDDTPLAVLSSHYRGCIIIFAKTSRK